jgi:hypothetical protein
MLVSVVDHHFVPSMNIDLPWGVHSTAQLCHWVASIFTSPLSWELLRP